MVKTKDPQLYKIELNSAKELITETLKRIEPYQDPLYCEVPAWKARHELIALYATTPSFQLLQSISQIYSSFLEKDNFFNLVLPNKDSKEDIISIFNHVLTEINKALNKVFHD